MRPAVGIGEDVRLTGQGISGAVRCAEERYVHLCAFTVEQERRRSRTDHQPSDPQTPGGRTKAAIAQ